jgi:hypothetical protein
MQTFPYNRDAAVSYAKMWALSRNPAYYDFSSLGGDCTNFASQCIYAGAGVMNYTPTFGWYYISPANRTASWTGVQFLYNFLINNESVGPYAKEVSEEEALPGDIIQLGSRDGNFYHTPVITEVSPRILVAAHSDDSLDRPLDTYRFANIRFLHIEGVRTW